MRRIPPILILTCNYHGSDITRPYHITAKMAEQKKTYTENHQKLPTNIVIKLYKCSAIFACSAKMRRTRETVLKNGPTE